MSGVAVKTDRQARCPRCGDPGKAVIVDGRDFLWADGKSPVFQIRRCDGCAIGFTDPVMTDAELAPYYPEQYEAYVVKGGLIGALQRSVYSADVRHLERASNGDRGSAYEMGGGRGEFLSTLMRRGWKVSGQEPSAAGRRTAKEAWGIELDPGYAGDLKFTKAHDAFIARHVLEHVEEPKRTLELVYRDGLRAGGVLFLKLPRMDSWEMRFFGRFSLGWDLPRHRTHFSRKGIRLMLEGVGFKDIVVKDEPFHLDLPRSVRVMARHGEPGWRRTWCRLLARLPYPLLFGASLLMALVLSPGGGAGRMIVTARK